MFFPVVGYLVVSEISVVLLDIIKAKMIDDTILIRVIIRLPFTMPFAIVFSSALFDSMMIYYCAVVVNTPESFTLISHLVPLGDFKIMPFVKSDNSRFPVLKIPSPVT